MENASWITHIKAGLNVSITGVTEFERVTDKDSDGGEDITPAEVFEIGVAVLESLSKSYNRPFNIVPIGDTSTPDT